MKKANRQVPIINPTATKYEKLCAQRQIVSWVRQWGEDNHKSTIDFSTLESKVYEVCKGMSYGETMQVFGNVVNEIGIEGRE